MSTTASTIDFGGLAISYDERIIEPRPWTEAQSRWASELLDGLPAGPVLELCAGAGHIGLAAVREHERALVQVDVDPVACDFARRNAAAAGMGARVAVRCGRLESALVPGEAFPLIVADPPYLRSDDITRFPEDPPLAIDGGPAGFDLIAACLTVIAGHLAPGGTALLQVAHPGQAGEVADHLQRRDGIGLAVVETRDCGRGALVRISATGQG